MGTEEKGFDLEGVCKAIAISLISGAVLIWASWVSFTVMTHIEIQSNNILRIAELEHKVVVLFQKVDKLEEGGGE